MGHWGAGTGRDTPALSSASHPTSGPLAEPTPNVEGGRPRAPEPGKEPTAGGGGGQIKQKLTSPLRPQSPPPCQAGTWVTPHLLGPPLGLSPLIPNPTPGSKAVTSAGRSPLHRPPLGGPSAGSPSPEAAPAAALLPLPLPERPLPTAQEPRLPPAGGRQSPHSLASQDTERGSHTKDSQSTSVPPRPPGDARSQVGSGRTGARPPSAPWNEARASLHDGSLRVCLF